MNNDSILDKRRFGEANSSPVDNLSCDRQTKGDIPVSNAPDGDAWKRLLYSEAWKQYCHEDNLGQSRNNFFLGVQGAMIAILTLAAKPLLELPPARFWNHDVYLGMTALGMLAAVIGLLALALDRHWKAVTDAGRAYLNIRWCTIMAIETTMELGHYGLASLERKWRAFSKTNSAKEFQPFSEPESLVSIKVPPLPEARGWSSIQKVVSVLEKIHWGVVVVGVALVALGIMGVGT
jgi:hypothetical protein